MTADPAARALANCRGGFRAGLLASLLALIAGCQSTVTYVSAPRDAPDAMVCSRCEGTGVVQPCPRCEGTGQTLRQVTVTRETGGPLGTSMPVPGKQVQVGPCQACGGTGVCRASAATVGTRTCDRCQGTGRVYRRDASEKGPGA